MVMRVGNRAIRESEKIKWLVIFFGAVGTGFFFFLWHRYYIISSFDARHVSNVI